MGVAALGAAMIVGSGLLTGLGGRWVLPRLPEPLPPDTTEPVADGDTPTAAHPAGGDPAVQAELDAKPAYRGLATARFGLISAATSAGGAAIAAVTQPVWTWPLWFVFGTVAVLLAAIDARTTWLPTVLVYAGWLAMVAALMAAVPASAAAGAAAAALLVRVLGCAGVAGGSFLLLWMLTRGRGFAFGDVRLMPLVGAVAGTMSWQGLYWSVLLGSLVGAAIGVAYRVRGRGDGLPYAPALVSGPYAAAVLLAVLA